MKRFHVNVSVADLSQSIEFYNTLFGQEPSVTKSDYAKWMLDDPRVNFAISESSRSRGVNHIGLQADTVDELTEIQERLRHADKQTFDQPNAECCYARSTKTWVRDPDAVAWETFVTHNEITHYGQDLGPDEKKESASGSRCCA
jgi:catechol 2,3-dioxygenase-like lactoylglutathione lyase family enzyme